MHNTIVFLAQAAPEGRVFALDTQTLVQIGIQLLNGCILAVALGLILYKPVKEFMQKRSSKIQSKIDDSDATMAKAKELISEYDIKIKNIDREREEVLEDARLKAVEEKRILLEEAREEAEKIKKRSLDIVEKEKERLKLESRVYVIELANLIAEKYITKNMDEEEQDKYFDEALAQLEETQWRK